MAMVCPQCNMNHEQRLQCPTCGTRLVYQEVRGRPGPIRPTEHWLQSFTGRLLIGLLLAQGLYIGLRHFCKGILMATQGEEALQQGLQTFEGLILVEALQLVPLFLGALLAGGGQRQGVVLGFLIGLCNSVLTMLLQVFLSHQSGALSWLGQPLLQGSVAAVAGWIGSAVWPALATGTLPPDRQLRKVTGAKKSKPLLAGRVAWFRVILGTLVAVAGSLWAEFLLNFALNASIGKLETTRLQDEIFTWEIKALAVLFGGALAGATTSNGFKQGLCVAVGTSLVLLAIPRSHTTHLVAFLTVFSAFTLSVAGGWFGGQLLPPVMPVKSTHKYGPSC